MSRTQAVSPIITPRQPAWEQIEELGGEMVGKLGHPLSLPKALDRVWEARPD